MREPVRCSVPGCEQPATATLEKRTLCRTHFISICYERMETHSARLKEQPLPEEIRTFLDECTPQIADLAKNARNLDDSERARLLEILLSAYNLSRHLRRSPRRKVIIPVRLRCEKPGQTWEERTETRMLSRYGALVDCQHPVEVGDTLLVERVDNARQVRARVAWQRRKWAGRLEIGLEFLDCDNFWELDWKAAESEA